MVDALKIIYEIELNRALPGLAAELKKTPGAFEQAYEYWLDKQIERAAESALSRKIVLVEGIKRSQGE